MFFSRPWQIIIVMFISFFIKGESGSELDNTKSLQADLDKLSWTKNFFSKFVLNGYTNYTRMQENLSPNLQKLLSLVKTNFRGQLPMQLVTDFRSMNKPLMKYTNIVQFNTRVIFLFLWLFIDQVWLYFVFDILVLTPILIYMVWRQEQVSSFFVKKIATENKYAQ